MKTEKLTPSNILVIILLAAISVFILVAMIIFIVTMMQVSNPDTWIACICFAGFLIVCLWFGVIAKLLQALSNEDENRDLTKQQTGDHHARKYP